MMRINMKRTLLSAAACFFVFSLNVGARAAHTEVACKSAPSAFTWNDTHGKYYVEWDQLRETPKIYFYDYWSEQKYPTLVGEFSWQEGVWVFYNQVPNSLVQAIHRRWKAHAGTYRNCAGAQGWRNTQYHYVPHRRTHRAGH